MVFKNIILYPIILSHLFFTSIDVFSLDVHQLFESIFNEHHFITNIIVFVVIMMLILILGEHMDILTIDAVVSAADESKKYILEVY